MSDSLFGRPAPEGYRLGYLKLRSVLWDRTAELPAFPAVLDRLRTMLDDRHHLGLIQLEIPDLVLVESIYGWQVFDRVTAGVAAALRGGLPDALPDDTVLAVDRVAGERFLAFVPEGPDGREPSLAWLADRGRRLACLVDGVLGGDDFDGIAPRLRARAGQALVSPNPFLRFERCVYAALREAGERSAARDRRRERAWGGELERIVERGSVEVYFQPIVALDGGEVLGYEALARGPEDSLFSSPRAMFELSRRVGVAGDLDRLCCETALMACGRLPTPGLAFVNLLAASLDDGEWWDGRLAALVRSRSLEPDEVVFELSEREAEEDPQAWQARLHRVGEAGYRLALDDVGTGRTERRMLEALRPDYLKLDPSLIRGLESNLIQQEVVRDLVELSQRCGATVIAEGVQTPGEARALREAGVAWGQGFLYGVPAPPETARPPVRLEGGS